MSKITLPKFILFIKFTIKYVVNLELTKDSCPNAQHEYPWYKQMLNILHQRCHQGSLADLDWLLRHLGVTTYVMTRAS